MKASDLVATKSVLDRLGHVLASERLGDFIEEAVKENLSHNELLFRLLSSELEAKEEKRAAINLKFSGLSRSKTLEDFDFGFQPSIDKNTIDYLVTCEFIVRKENLLVFGPPGVGKTHLASAIGLKAIARGFSVTFLTLDQLMERLKKEERTPTFTKRHRRCHLLIIDEIGYRPLDAKEANLFFGLVSKRYENASTIITSNKGVKDWPQFLAADETLTAAILDRLLHHAYVVSINGSSYRLKDKEAMFIDN